MRESKTVIFYVFNYSENSCWSRIDKIISGLCQIGYIHPTEETLNFENVETDGHFFDLPLKKGKLKLKLVKRHACIGVLELPCPYNDWDDKDNQAAINELKVIFDTMLVDHIMDNYTVNGCVNSLTNSLYLFLSVGRNKWFLRDFTSIYSLIDIKEFYNEVCLKLPVDKNILSIERSSFFGDKIFIHRMDRLSKRLVGRTRKDYYFKKKKASL